MAFEMTRRQLLQTGFGAIAAAGVLPTQARQNEAGGTMPAPPKAKMTSSVMLWTLKGSFEERVAAAARAGLQSVELIDEYIHWTDADVARQKNLVASYMMGMDTILASSDWVHRPVSMVDPAQRENFLKDVQNAIVYAKKLEVPQIILMSGNDIPGRTHEEQYASLLEGTKRAGDLAAKADLTMIVEPLNSKVNHKGFFLTTCGEGLKLVKEVDNPHVKLLYDIYHEQTQVGNTETLTEAADHVAVFHVADSPGRHDPGTGQMDYKTIYQAIQKTGYSGYITMEYLPVIDPAASLQKSVDAFRAALLTTPAAIGHTAA
jgi:hydroxypyruvate isomerase